MSKYLKYGLIALGVILALYLLYSFYVTSRAAGGPVT